MAYIKGQAFIAQYVDANGDTASGQSFEFYLSGTSTPTNVYKDSSGTVLGTSFTLNSLGKPQDSGGTEVDVYFDTDVAYKIIHKDSGGTQIDPVIDPFYPSGYDSMQSVETVAALKALTSFTDGFAIFVRGYASTGDGGGGIYTYDSSSSETANDGTVIDPTTISGRFILHNTEKVTPRTFGTGDAGIISAVSWAIANNQMLFWPEVYAVTTNITSFHDARHYGPGGISRGGNTWYVEQSPSQEDRRLYVSTASGASTNDGLDTSNPLAAEPAAITAMLRINPNNGETGFITLKSDHVITDDSMMTIDKVNAGWIVVEGDGTFGESGYTYSSSYPSTGWTYNAGDHNPVPCNCTADITSRYIVGNEAGMPELRVFIDGNSQLDRAYSGNLSTGKVEETYGGKNFRANTSARPLYVSGGNIKSSRTVWDTFTGSIYWARGDGGNFTQSLVKNRTSIANGSLTVSRTGSLEAQGVEFQGCAIPIETKRGAQLNALDAIIDDVAESVAVASRGSILCLDGGIATNVHAEGVNCSRAATVSWGQGTTQPGSITASSSSSGTEAAIKCSGGEVSCPNLTIDGGSSGSGFEDGILVQQDGDVDATAVTIQGDITRNAAYCIGADLSITSADTSGVVGAINELAIDKGGTIKADAITTTSGSLVAGDTNVGALNTLSSSGVIFG